MLAFAGLLFSAWWGVLVDFEEKVERSKQLEAALRIPQQVHTERARWDWNGRARGCDLAAAAFRTGVWPERRCRAEAMACPPAPMTNTFTGARMVLAGVFIVGTALQRCWVASIPATSPVRLDCELSASMAWGQGSKSPTEIQSMIPALTVDFSLGKPLLRPSFPDAK